MNLTEQIQYMHRFFHTGKTYNLNFRLYFLKKLKRTLFKYEEEIAQALYIDFKKPYAETYQSELLMVFEELNMTIKHLKKWARTKTHKTPLPLVSAYSQIKPIPYGLCAIFVPFNYPFQLTFSPLIGALASGNCIVLKLSEYTPATNKVIQSILKETFPRHLVWAIEGDASYAERLLKQPLDYIFFTGSSSVGKKVMHQASKHLTPITLELGGKNPVIVDYNANLALAALRIAWGKFMNAGQTCIAPDYILVHDSVVDEFIDALQAAIYKLYPNPKKDMARIISEKHCIRLIEYINEDKVVYGGDFDTDTCYIAPTVLYPVSIEDACMQDEIFGPILPIIPFTKLSSALELIQRYPKPLASYLFGSDPHRLKYLHQKIISGGCCINDTIMHIVDLKLPFGGVGYSGMGSYHGHASFKTFSHYKSTLIHGHLELPIRYSNDALKVNLLKKYLSFKFKSF